MPNYRILWVQVVLLICVIGFPGDLAAQYSDSTVWYSGTSVFAGWARPDSSAAAALFRSLNKGDKRFLVLKGYGDSPVGIIGDSHAGWEQGVAGCV